MSRVSENSSSGAVNFAIAKAKSKLEDLQLRGSTMKSFNRPSDNPISNVESLSLRSAKSDNIQFTRNSNFALMNLNATEQALKNMTELMIKAKEIAVAQASDIYNGDVRKNISNDIIQVRNEMLVLANKRIGNKYIFGGYSTLKPPFDKEGNYNGDSGQMSLEVAKDFFVPINLNGVEAFFTDNDTNSIKAHPLDKFKEMRNVPKYDVAKEPRDKGNKDDKEVIKDKEDKINNEPAGDNDDANNIQPPPKTSTSRDLASVTETDEKFSKRDNVFSQLNTFIVALESNDADIIQDLLEKFDNTVSRFITLRTRIGSITNSVESAKNGTERQNIDFDTRQSQISDADVADLFSDIQKQQQILKTTYQAGKATLNKTLMDFVL